MPPQMEMDRTRATHREIELMKSRIESSEHLSSLKVSLVAALAVISERFTSLVARVDKLEKSTSAWAKKEKKAERKKISKADVGGPQVGSFVHVAGMGLKDGEMKTTGMPTTMDWSREQEGTGAAPRSLSLDPVLVQFLCQAGLDPASMSPQAIAEAKEFAEKENLHGVVREAEKRTQRKKKIVASPRMRKRSSATQLNNELQGRILDLESLVREMYVQGEEMKEKVARMEKALAEVLGQKLNQLPSNQAGSQHQHQLAAGDQAGSQYQSAEQLINEVDHQSISHQVSAILDQQRCIVDHNEDEEEVKQRDPFNIPEEEEFFIARQTFRTAANQS